MGSQDILVAEVPWLVGIEHFISSTAVSFDLKLP